MPKFLFGAALLAAVALAAPALRSYGQTNPKPGENPILRDVFTADPAPLVYKDRVYLYVGHDEAKEGQMFNMNDWRCYSSSDMKTWTAHGSIMNVRDFKWATKDAWASQVVARNGKFYFYAAVQEGAPANAKAIGVAVSDSPTGPFVDARGSALVSDKTTPGPNGWDDIDPTVFVDDDGTAWLAWGNPNCYLAKLKPNMTELDGPVQRIEVPNYTEGPWLHKRGNTYYLTYAAFAHQGMWEKLCYATAPRVTGPWTYQGILTEQAKNSYTIHPGIVEFRKQWYLFYHNATLTLPTGESGALGRRSVCAEYLYYNPDGTIQPIAHTVAGLSVPPRQGAQPAPPKRPPSAPKPAPLLPASLGVTLTENTQPRPGQWPGSPVFSTMPNPATLALDNLSFNHKQGVSSLGQTFEVPTDCRLTRLDLFGGDGFGTDARQPVALALYDLGPAAGLAADAPTYSTSNNLLGSANGLNISYTPQAAGILQFDFATANQVVLKAGHRYALELQGVAKSAPLFWRVSRQDTYAGGSAYQNRQPVLLNDKRGYDFALAVYGAPLKK
ncbi:glycoside hydrolase family 43 protein [Hymenobacter monticola]|uniref:Glycoside hydrolase family 43 protein n=1 Tax=Hymenobacter monticola TaxID=1705399 RepID=A0ABY4B0W3_9BACT|nr:glycoside hydrolase family 43 protein [Hymenobacter monticola]UOE32454.1 glycoside hydrolase family 43 protein [Hymenobacter monticola]